MFRFVKSNPALVEAHARTQQAMNELERAVKEAFERYDQLASRLEAFDARLGAARVKCHAEPIGDRPRTARESGDVRQRDRSQDATSRGGRSSRPRTFSRLPARA
jgi:hypothetical protein